MVFKKLMKAMGVGGPSVETTLHNPNTTPGGTITGDVHLLGGDHDSDIKYVSVALKTRVEVESGDSEYHSDLEYAKIRLTDAFELKAGARHTVPFSLQIPWEAPLTHMYGQPLHGTTVGVATELEVARAVDATDLDPIAVHPLPAQERILVAFANLGFRFRNADCEKGRIWGVHQELPFYQEIEFYPAPQYASGIKQLEVTFVSYPQSMEVVLELDKRGGVFTEGHDSFARFTVDYASVNNTNWEQQLEGYLNQAARRRGFF
ncbi:sporulation-control protein [Thermomonospora echinospora]|uniref:Sporulation-control protein n=1 Tax=Thermomonospora echinospora TaxID=1992 RepID=A0A1H6CIS0_9ACTN|nr:sporulation protein [Thermomonospora echinospora]SEG72822.1 sporulation-control protein [Thermomonospora echinospora]